jgi:hypothetical protein
MAATTDPITQVYSALWSALNAWHGFTDLVRVQVDLTQPQYASIEALPPTVRDADLPEVTLFEGRYTLAPFGRSSQVAEIQQEYRLVCATNSLQVIPINAVKYNVLVALLKAGDTLGLDGLVYSYVIYKGSDDTSRMALGTNVVRGVDRYTSLLSIRVSMYLDRATLLALT